MITRIILPLLFSAFLAGATYIVKERRASALVASPEARSEAIAPAPSNAREAWALDFLAALGNDAPTAETVGMVVEWQIAEDGSDGALARNNPLNSTLCNHNIIGSINSDGACGVAHYATYQDGLDASIDTITQSNFMAIAAALQSNDAEGAKQALWASPWASSHYCNGGCWPAYRMEQPAAPAQASATGGAYMLQGDVGVNVMAALNANNGALMGFTIQPGETWSFGHSIAPISAMGYLPVVCGPAGCNAGGGWCDLSALYIKVADQLGLESSFPAHIGVSDTRFPGILLDDNGNGGDLTIYNPTPAPVTFRAIVGEAVTIEGGMG